MVWPLINMMILLFVISLSSNIIIIITITLTIITTNITIITTIITTPNTSPILSTTLITILIHLLTRDALVLEVLHRRRHGIHEIQGRRPPVSPAQATGEFRAVVLRGSALEGRLLQAALREGGDKGGRRRLVCAFLFILWSYEETG